MIRVGKIERLTHYGSSARETAIDRGHDPSALRADTDTSMVSVCRRCGAILAVDADERPYVFGKMYEEDCHAG